MNFRNLLETYKELGKLSDLELMKGKKLNPDTVFIEVSGRIFEKVISKIKVNDLAKGDKSKGLNTLTIYPVKDYLNMKCFLGPNNSSGYALHNSELVSVFSSQHSSGDAIVKSAINNGAKHLDCFAERHNNKISGQLYSLYLRNGFKIDKNMNLGKKGEAYSIQNGISSFVDDNDIVHENDPKVVIFMKL